MVAPLGIVITNPVAVVESTVTTVQLKLTVSLAALGCVSQPCR
ncbi:hypothetical protein [Dyella acidisoli]|nr:hypothetical protein [Dyella acidisoli]